MQTDAIPKLLLTVKEACEALGGICPRTLYSRTHPRGSIPSVRIGSRVLYAVPDLEAAIERMKVGPAHD
jgi:hypothetical protein